MTLKVDDNSSSIVSGKIVIKNDEVYLDTNNDQEIIELKMDASPYVDIFSNKEHNFIDKDLNFESGTDSINYSSSPTRKFSFRNNLLPYFSVS